MDDLLSQTVTLIGTEPAGQDPFHNPIPGKEIRTEQPGCSVQPAATNETTDHRDQVTADATLYGPPDMTVTALTAVEIDGERYEVIGQPARWPGIAGSLAHTVVQLRKVTG